MRIIERANCYGMLGSCEGLKSLPRRRCRRGCEGLLSKAVGAGMGHHMSIVGSDALDPLIHCPLQQHSKPRLGGS